MKKILLTNDDGYHAKGIKALEQALEEMAEIYVVAPKHEKAHARNASRSPRL